METLLSPFLGQPIVWFSSALAIVTAWLMGFSRSGIGAGGFVVSPLMVLALGAADGLAIIAVLMIPAGIMGSWQYRKNTDRKLQSALIPGAFVGTAMGGLVLWALIRSGEDSEVHRRMEYLVAGLSLVYVILVSFRTQIARLGGGGGPARWSGIFGMGTTIGLSQTVANSGTPLMTLYFVRHGLKKDQYVAAQNIFLLAQNLLKLVPFVALGILHLNNAAAALILFPLTLLGSWIGRKFARSSSDKTFFTLYIVLLVAGFVSSALLLWGRSNFFRLLGS